MLRVEGRDADLERGVDVADRLAVGIVEMAAQPPRSGSGAGRAPSPPAHFLRRADADRVGDAAVVDADLLHQPHDVLDLVGRHGALVRATERARDRRAHLDAVLVRGGHHRPEALDALGDRAVDVLPAERFGGRGEDDDLVGPLLAPYRQCGLEPFHVGHQRRVAHAFLARDAGEHGRVVGHLRHPFRADEAGDLDLAQPGRLQPMHELDLDGGLDRLLLVLQPVARADVDEGDLGRQHGRSFRRRGERNGPCSRR